MGYNKIQQLGFRTVDEFLDFLPGEELELVETLRELILETCPDVQERLAYNVPYYFRNRRVCFLWPASIPWGKVKMQGVMMGICNGNLLNDHQYFNLGERKQVATRIFHKLAEEDFDLIRYYLQEAIRIDRKFD